MTFERNDTPSFSNVISHTSRSDCTNEYLPPAILKSPRTEFVTRVIIPLLARCHLALNCAGVRFSLIIVTAARTPLDSVMSPNHPARAMALPSFSASVYLSTTASIVDCF